LKAPKASQQSTLKLNESKALYQEISLVL
jgi:hypothetical protein